MINYDGFPTLANSHRNWFIKMCGMTTDHAQIGAAYASRSNTEKVLTITFYIAVIIKFCYFLFFGQGFPLMKEY